VKTVTGDSVVTYAKHVFFTLGILWISAISGVAHSATVSDLTKVDVSIHKVLKQYPNHVQQYAEQYRLLLIETAVVESDAGIYINCMGNYGHYQIRGTSGKELITDLKSQYPDIYQIVMKHFNKQLSLKDNLIQNLDFSTALCVAYYCTKLKDPEKQLSTVESRAATWKKLYNTYRGAGTVSKYIKVNKPIHQTIPKIKPLFSNTNIITEDKQ